MADLTIIILTFNEAKHLERCINSIKSITGNVIVVDSYSTDQTLEIAKKCGATVIQNKFINQAVQFQWALDNGGITTAWVMRLDADELVETALAEEIVRRLPQLGPDVVGINLKRKHIFMNRWIRHGGRYPLVLLRIWRVGQGRVERKWMDEHVVVWGGKIMSFDGTFADHNLNDLTFFTEKHNSYATREAIEVLSQKYRLLPKDERWSRTSASSQAYLKRWIKERIYNRLPLWVAPLGYFSLRYFVQLGFLDGRPGLIYHFLQGFWYRFLVAAKVAEYDMTLAPLTDAPARILELQRLTGHNLSES